MIRVSAKIICAVVIAAAPAVVFGADSYQYVKLIGVPYLDPNSQSVEQYVNALYRISITLAAILAVLKLIIAGAKYILTDIITSKEDAKKDIRGALVGLLIVISAVVLLQVINDNLTRFNFLEGLDKGFKIDVLTRPEDKNCQNAPNSYECCRLKGGEYISTNNGNICSLGEVIDDEQYNTGDEFDDKLNCENDGNSWNPNTKKCQEKPKNYIPIPAGYLTDSEKRMFCSGSGHKYDAEQSVCIPE